MMWSLIEICCSQSYRLSLIWSQEMVYWQKVVLQDWPVVFSSSPPHPPLSDSVLASDCPVPTAYWIPGEPALPSYLTHHTSLVYIYMQVRIPMYHTLSHVHVLILLLIQVYRSKRLTPRIKVVVMIITILLSVLASPFVAFAISFIVVPLGLLYIYCIIPIHLSVTGSSRRADMTTLPDYQMLSDCTCVIFNQHIHIYMYQ